MNRWKSVLALATGAVLLSLALTACSGPFGGNCTPKGGSAGTAAATVKVVADSKTVGAYKPATISVPTGQSIEWVWEDSGNPHSVTAGNGNFDSCLQNAGARFAVVFTAAGTYAYTCSIHPDMKGTINVT
jgi:plastocyanin